MDQKRLFLAIAISVAILLVFQVLIAPHMPQTPTAPQQQTASQNPAATQVPAGVAAKPGALTVPKEVPRVKIAAHRVSGSISLLGARLDDLVLADYRETLAPNSPNVRLLEPRSDAKPYYVQYGWSAAPGEQVKLPDNDTVWATSSDTLSSG